MDVVKLKQISAQISKTTEALAETNALLYFFQLGLMDSERLAEELLADENYEAMIPLQKNIEGYEADIKNYQDMIEVFEKDIQNLKIELKLFVETEYYKLVKTIKQ